MAIRLKDTASVNISGSAGSAGSATKATQDASGNVITSTYATKSELTSGLSGKVDKVSGKGLSTNDFTTALKTKLEGLSNYDDTALTTAVNNLTTRFNTLLETDTTAAIESFNEIIAFLNGIADTETLEGIVAGIESQISTVEGKIPTKVSQLTNDSGYVKNTAVATSSALGLIKSGGDITVASDGTVSVANNSHTHTIANITNLQTTLDGKASTAVATASSAGLMSAEDKAALDGLITTGGEVNQNAFSNVKVDSTTIAADSKTDTLELAAGTNVTLTPDATNDKVTIAATDTTYTFANGTNGFTVTPSGGTAQTVTVTPSIDNNVTGSGTSGYLTKFNGANSVTNGPQLGTSTTTYLRNDGTWATPKDTTYSALSATDATAGTATTGRLISAKVLHDKITEMLPDEVTTTEGDTGLMTASDKSKLDGIAEGANKYTHPTYTAKSSGLYKITVDEIGHVSGTTAVVKSDITALGIPGSDTNTTYTFKSGTNKFTVTPSNGTATDITVTPSIDNNVTYTGTLVDEQVAAFEGTSGTIKASGYTIAKSVPSDAKFTDTDTKVTSAANHYDPAEDTSAAISAASGTATDVTGTSGKLNVVTGVKRDAKGHIVGVTSANIYSKDTTYSAGNGLTLSGTTLAVGAGTGISVSADAVGLATSGVTAGSYGPSANVSGGSGATISVPSITVDDYGRVTSIANKTYTSSTLPTSLKNPTSMTVQLNGGTTEGTNKFTYDGSAAKSLNITASSVGAAAATHSHTKSEITDFPTLATVATSGSYNDLSNKPTIPTVPSSLKNPNSITFKGAGTSVFSYDGSAAKSLDIVAGSNVTVTADATNSKITIAATDTTYSSKAAASGGTAVSLVTTGEKAIWNAKTSNTGTVTSVATGVGLTGGSITTSGTVKAKLRSETALTVNSAAATTTSGRVYPVAVDKSGYLSVNVPWSDTNTTYSAATTSANGLMSSTDKSRLDFMHTANSRTTLASIPVTGSIVTATLSAATSISVAAAMTIGQSVTVICTPSASFTQPIPTSGNFISMDGDSLKVTSGKKFEINILCYASSKYSISCKTAV